MSSAAKKFIPLPDHKEPDLAALVQKQQRWQRYLSPTVAKMIVNAPQEKPFGDQASRKRISFMFIDIRDFTHMADILPPETVSDVLTEYYNGVDEIIQRHRGVINKFLGDGLLVIFGDPLPNKNHRNDALNAAIEIRDFVKGFAARVSYLPQAFQIGIGINTGKALVGNFGSKAHTDYTAIGPAVNLAARLQAQASSGQIVVSAATFEGLENEYDLHNLRTTPVKGVTEPVSVADLLARKVT